MNLLKQESQPYHNTSLNAERKIEGPKLQRPNTVKCALETQWAEEPRNDSQRLLPYLARSKIYFQPFLKDSGS